jgi:ABC-2 type transport system ATP-binding protein
MARRGSGGRGAHVSGIAAPDDAPTTAAVSASSLAGGTAATHAVVLEGISKSFPVRRTWGEMLRHPTLTPRAPVLQNINLAVTEGEFFGLLGPNGAGKTTLFKMLATLVLPDAGTATVGGYDVVAESQKVRSVLAPVIADERSLYWRLTAYQNLELFAKLQGMHGAAVHTRVTDVLDVVGLSDTAEKIVAAFSSGMKQRLLIARALVAQPRVLLLDEPTRSLDPISARGFRAFLREEISGRQGCTVLLATHSADEVLELCTRVAVLDHGRLLATGTTTSLARDLGEERYALFTRDANHPALAALVQRGVVGALAMRGSEDGWERVDMELAGGMEHASQVVATLVEQGVVVARFERVPLPLADLIDRIVRRGAEGPSNG